MHSNNKCHVPRGIYTYNISTYNMYYSTHTRNLASIFEFFLWHEEPAVKGVCHLPVKVGYQSTLTLLLRWVSPHGLRILCGCGSLYIRMCITIFYFLYHEEPAVIGYKYCSPYLNGKDKVW